MQPYRASAAPPSRFPPRIERLLRRLAPRHRFARKSLGGHWERRWLCWFGDVGMSKHWGPGKWEQVRACSEPVILSSQEFGAHVSTECEDWD